jgi:hypothetical protein
MHDTYRPDRLGVTAASEEIMDVKMLTVSCISVTRFLRIMLLHSESFSEVLHDIRLHNPVPTACSTGVSEKWSIQHGAPVHLIFVVFSDTKIELPYLELK